MDELFVVGVSYLSIVIKRKTSDKWELEDTPLLVISSRVGFCVRGSEKFSMA